jgi:hypothetical protein
MPGVISALPFGDTKMVTVNCSKDGAVSEKIILQALEKRKDIKFVSIEQTVGKSADN